MRAMALVPSNSSYELSHSRGAEPAQIPWVAAIGCDLPRRRRIGEGVGEVGDQRAHDAPGRVLAVLEEPPEPGDQDAQPSPRTSGCEECLQSGDRWLHLRLCLVCGHVGCCDDSKNKHATKHFRATKHPIVTSFEPGEDWSWCYIDEVAMEPG